MNPDVFVAFQTPDPSQVFTDMLALLTNLGIQTYILNAIAAIVVLAVSAALLRFVRGN